MSPYRRNTLVGITVLGAIIVLGWMLVRFGGAPAKMFRKTKQIPVHFLSDRADGLSEGSQVFYRGRPVGRVLTLRPDENQLDVIIDAIVDETPPLPANVAGEIRVQSLISGAAALNMELVGGPTTRPQGKLEAEAQIACHYVGNDLIPPQIAQLASELEKTSRDVRDTRLIAHLDESIRNAAEVLKSLQQYVDDPKLRDDVRVSLANFRQLTETANRAASNVEKFSSNLQKVSDDASATMSDARAAINKTQQSVDLVSHRLDDRIVQTSKLLDSLQSIATKVDNGPGTASKLLNDPKLYQGLVSSTQELNATITDLRRLVEQWEQEGVSLKLKN